MELTLEYLKNNVIPVLQKEHTNSADLTKAVSAFLKQGEEEIPVVNEAGEPVDIAEIILVGAAPAEGAEDESVSEGDVQLSIQSTIQKEIKSAMKEFTKSSSHRVGSEPTEKKVWASPRGRHTKVFKDENGRPDDYKAYAFSRFLGASAFKDEQCKAWLEKEGFLYEPAIRETLMKSQTVGIASAGGVFVPVELSGDIIRLVDDFGVFRQNANVMPMTSAVEVVPRILAEGAAEWVGETGSFSESDDTNDSVELIAKELGKLIKVSKSLMADASISMADRAAQSIAQKIAEAEDDAAFNGDGTSTYGGNHGFSEKLKDGNHAAGLVTATSGDDSFAEILIGDLQTLQGTVHPAAMKSGNAKWYISQMGFAKCFQRLTAAQGGTNRSEIESGPNLQFEGSPVVITNSLYNSATALDAEVAILYGDMNLAATLGDREQVSIDTSTERYFEQRMVGILGVERVAINVHDIGDGTTAGPIVGLQFTA